MLPKKFALCLKSTQHIRLEHIDNNSTMVSECTNETSIFIVAFSFGFVYFVMQSPGQRSSSNVPQIQNQKSHDQHLRNRPGTRVAHACQVLLRQSVNVNVGENYKSELP